MIQLFSLRNHTIEEATAVTVGKFDGIHRGHELLIDHLLAQKEAGLKSVVLTFDISPRIQLNKDMAKLLISNEERVHLFEQSGIDYFSQCSFEDEIRSMEPEEFVSLLVSNYHMKYLVCGSDFHFGKMGRGEANLLRELSGQYDFELKVLDKLTEGQREISSTYVREEIAAGHIKEGNQLLGYPYFIWGTVVHGKHLGTKIGIPTINMIPPADKLLPKNGVYITNIEIDHHTYHGVTNVGCKPTVQGDKMIGIETHILDFNQNVYEKQARVIFLDRIRDEVKFNSVEELKNQMHLDKKRALQYFNVT